MANLAALPTPPEASVFHSPSGLFEKTFYLAHGHYSMPTETRDTDAILFGQIQEGPQYSLMESPAVYGAANYQVLCVAAERRKAALKKRNLSSSTEPLGPLMKLSIPASSIPAPCSPSSPDSSPPLDSFHHLWLHLQKDPICILQADPNLFTST